MSSISLRTAARNACLAWAPLGLLLLVVNPAKLSIIFLVVPFILLFFGLYYTLLFIFILWQRQKAAELSLNERRLAKVCSVFIVILIVLQSLGQLTVRDVATLLLVFVIGYFYILRGSKQQKGP